MGVLNGKSDPCHSLPVYSLFSAPDCADVSSTELCNRQCCHQPAATASAVLRSYGPCQSIIYDEVCITSPTITLALTKHCGGNGALLEGSGVCGHCPVKPWHPRCSESGRHSMHRDTASLPSDSSISVFPACTCLFQPVKSPGLGLSPAVGKYKSLEVNSWNRNPTCLKCREWGARCIMMIRLNP